MSIYDEGLWVVDDSEIWVTSDDLIWIPVIIRGVITFIAVRKNYLLESNYENYIYISKPSEDQHEFIGNNIVHLFVSNPSEDEDEFVGNNINHLFVAKPVEDEHEFISNNINTTFVSNKRSAVIDSKQTHKEI